VPSVTPSGDYVDCCICSWDLAYTLFTYSPRLYLPIKKTLYCTWGRWAGNLYWDTQPDPSAPSVVWHNVWSGIQTIHFDRWPSYDGYGNCVRGPADRPAIVTLGCGGGPSVWIYYEAVRPPVTPYWLGVLQAANSTGIYPVVDCDGGFSLTADTALGGGAYVCGDPFDPPDDMRSYFGHPLAISITEV